MVRKLKERISGGQVRIAIALLLMVASSVLFWASRDYAVIAPDWDGQVRGISYDPSHLFTDKQHRWISPERIDEDMAQLGQITSRVRTSPQSFTTMGESSDSHAAAAATGPTRGRCDSTCPTP